MGLDRWGVSAAQGDIASIIRPNPNDGHVSIGQIRSAAADYGMETLYFPAGDADLVKAFVAAGFPVMMPTWHIDSPRNQMGHYRLVHGYDDQTAQFAVRDSLEPIGYRMGYREFDLLWRVFNRRMVVVYPANRTDEVRDIGSSSGSETDMLEASLTISAGETAPPAELPEGMSAGNYMAYTEFNRAMVLTALGRYEEGAEAVVSAFDIGLPWRMLWYQPEVLESVYEAGDFQWIVNRAGAALNPYPYLEELWYWMGRAQAKLGNRDEALEAFRRALDIQPGWGAATQALEMAVVEIN
jgi:tetratricopeptide (TPR) repeat protein